VSAKEARKTKAMKPKKAAQAQKACEQEKKPKKTAARKKKGNTRPEPNGASNCQVFAVRLRKGNLGFTAHQYRIVLYVIFIFCSPSPR
jgi:hypothetical protein